MPAEFRAHLSAWQEEAAAALAGHLGSQTMCQLHKDGRVTGGVKYEEGRMAAWAALHRALKDAPPGSDLQATLETACAEWAALLARHQADALPAIPWVAYAQGGVDACQRAREWLRSSVS